MSAPKVSRLRVRFLGAGGGGELVWNGGFCIRWGETSFQYEG